MSELGAASRSNDAAVVPEPEFEVRRSRARRVRRRADARLLDPRAASRAGARSTRSRSRRGSSSIPARPRLRRGDSRAALRPLRASRQDGRDDAEPRLGAGRGAGPDLHRRGRRSTSRSPAPTTSRSRRPSTSRRWPDGSRPARLPLHRDDLLPRRRGPAADRPRAVELHRALPDARHRLAQDDGRLLRADGLDPAPRGDARRLRRRQTERGAPSFDAVVADLLRRVDDSSWTTSSRLCSTRATRSTPTRRARRRTRRRRRSGSSIPPAYAAGSRATFDHLQVQCLAAALRSRRCGRRSSSCSRRRASRRRSSGASASERSSSGISGAVVTLRWSRRSAAPAVTVRVGNT